MIRRRWILFLQNARSVRASAVWRGQSGREREGFRRRRGTARFTAWTEPKIQRWPRRVGQVNSIVHDGSIRVLGRVHDHTRTALAQQFLHFPLIGDRDHVQFVYEFRRQFA